MEFRQLEYFVAVAEEHSFTRGAERMQISQPGVSAQIQHLERELGAPLFDRSRRNITLTPVGKAALEHARDALVSVRAMHAAVDEVTGLLRGDLAIGMITACTVTVLFDALATFHEAHPGVRISLTEESSDSLVQQVHEGTLDLALIGVPDELPSGVKAMPVASERLAAVVPRSHPLAGRSLVSLRQLSDYQVICMPAGTGIRAVFDHACAVGNVWPDVALQASAPGAIVHLALRGLGIAILTESIAAAYADQMAAVVLSDVETPAVLALVWKADAPALRAFLGHAHRACAPPPLTPQ